MLDIAHLSSVAEPYETARSGAPCALFPGLEGIGEISLDKLPRGVVLIPSCARVLGAILSPQAPAEPHRRSGAALRREPPEASPLNNRPLPRLADWQPAPRAERTRAQNRSATALDPKSGSRRRRSRLQHSEGNSQGDAWVVFLRDRPVGRSLAPLGCGGSCLHRIWAIPPSNGGSRCPQRRKCTSYFNCAMQGADKGLNRTCHNRRYRTCGDGTTASFCCSWGCATPPQRLVYVVSHLHSKRKVTKTRPEGDLWYAALHGGARFAP